MQIKNRLLIYSASFATIAILCIFCIEGHGDLSYPTTDTLFLNVGQISTILAILFYVSYIIERVLVMRNKT